MASRLAGTCFVTPSASPGIKRPVSRMRMAMGLSAVTTCSSRRATFFPKWGMADVRFLNAFRESGTSGARLRPAQRGAGGPALVSLGVTDALVPVVVEPRGCCQVVAGDRQQPVLFVVKGGDAGRSPLKASGRLFNLSTFEPDAVAGAVCACPAMCGAGILFDPVPFSGFN